MRTPSFVVLLVWLFAAPSLLAQVPAPNSASVFPVDVNGQPNVALTAPANGAVVQAGQSVTITATASDPDGDAIARVEYDANGGFIGQATAPPYALTAGGIAGTYSLVARAVDVRGGGRDSAASMLYVNAPPSVAITTPPSGTTVLLGQTLTFGASVSDPEGNPVTVVYEANGGAISSAIGAPYTFSAPASAPGSFSVTARATDSRGGVTVSAPIVVNIQVPTSIAITSPPNGTTYAVGQAITIVAAASDPDGVNRVEFSYNGGVPAGTVTVPPYQLGLPGGAPAGTYTIVARMVDNLGNAVTSAPVTIYVTGSFVRHETPTGDEPPPASPGDDGPGSGSATAESQGAWRLAVQRARADGLRASRRARARVRRLALQLRGAHRRATPLLAACLVLLGLATPAQAQVKIEYYHLDPIGSVRMVTDSAGAEVARYDYHPFGEEVPPVTSGQTRRYAGKERDAETSYDYFGGRYHAGRVGRFTTVDPAYELEDNLLDPQRWNRYAYVRNNPLRYSDPDGRIIETLWDAANVIMGARSLVANVATGNWAGAAVDTVGIIADAAATLAPGAPGGAGTAIRAARGAENALTVARAPQAAGRAGRQARLRELADDTSLGAADRGWLRQEINSIERGNQRSIRNPPGKDLAHERGREAAKGYSYKYSHLQDRSNHRTQHKYDNYGPANAERPPK